MINDKISKFKEELKKFDSNKNKTIDDYVSFCFASNNVLKQGSGLTWDGLKEVIEETLFPENELKRFRVNFYKNSDKNNPFYSCIIESETNQGIFVKAKMKALTEENFRFDRYWHFVTREEI